MIELRVPGLARGKGRPRFDSRHGRTYTPAATTLAENDVRAVWREAGQPRVPDDAAIALDVVVVLERPAAHRRRDGELSAAGLRQPTPLRKPDVDNALKLVMDALNGCAYRDDVQVVVASVERRWGPTAETLIRVMPIDSERKVA